MPKYIIEDLNLETVEFNSTSDGEGNKKLTLTYIPNITIGPAGLFSHTFNEDEAINLLNFLKTHSEEHIESAFMRASMEAEAKYKGRMSKLFERVLLLEEEVFSLKKENFALKNGNPDVGNTEEGAGI
jgi:hypothetical protein